MRGLLLFLYTIISFVAIGQQKEIEQLRNIESPFESILYADSLLRFSNYNDVEVSRIKYYKALAFQDNADHKKSLKLLGEVKLAFNENDTIYIKTLLGLSNSNMCLENTNIAIQQAIEALDLAKKNKIYGLVASANTAISFIHYSNKDYAQALLYLENSVKLQSLRNDSVRLSATYNNLAIIYKNIGEFDQAFDYNKESLKISIETKDSRGIGKSYSNIGRVYEMIGDTDSAFVYYQKAIENNIKTDFVNSIPYRNMGDLYTTIKDYQKAEKNYFKAIDIESKNENHIVMYTIYTALLNNSIQNKDFEKALKYQKKKDISSNINLKHANEEKVKMIDYQYKFLANESELTQEKEINDKNKIIFGVILGILSIGLLYWYQKNKNSKLKIAQEKLRLEQDVLRSQMNPHFIFNALSAIQNSLLDNEPIKSAGYLSKFAKLIRQNFDFINQNQILLKEEIDALQNYMDTQKMRFNDKFDYEINVFADVNVNSEEIPPLLIQPFIENAIEHGFKNKKEKGSIVISISKQGNRICYEIIDNGKGINSNKKDRKIHAIDIFKKRISLLNNGDEKSFEISSSEKGTHVKFSLVRC